MIYRLIILLITLGAVACRSASQGVIQIQPPDPAWQKHSAWLTDAMVRMQTIKPGMTRSDLLKVFTTEGGIVRDTYVSRDCPYCKVDVEFEGGGRINRDAAGRVISIGDGRDVIVRISRVYLEFAIID